MTTPPNPTLTRAVLSASVLSSRIVTTVAKARHGEASDPVHALQDAQRLCHRMLADLQLAELELVAQRLTRPA